MTIVKEYEKRVVVPYDWIGSSDDCVLLCLKREWLDVIIRYVKKPLQYPTTYQVELFSDGSYMIPDDVQMVIASQWADDLLLCLEDSKMSNCGDLVSAIQELAAAAASSSSSSACGCPGGTEPEAGVGSEGGVPPDGFDDTGLTPGEQDYQDRKCEVSNVVFDWVVDALTTLDNASADTIIGAIVSGGWSVAAGWLLGLLAGLTFGWVLAVVAVAFIIIEQLIEDSFDLSLAISVIQNNKDNLVCALYNSTSSDQARDDFVQEFEDSGGQTGARLILETALLVNNVTNALFFDYDDPTRQQKLESAIANLANPTNCSSICPDCVSTIFWGTGDPELGGTLDSVPDGNVHKLSWYTGTLRTFNITSESGITPHLGTNEAFRVWSLRDTSCGDGSPGSVGDIYNSDVNPIPVVWNNCGKVAIYSNTPFTIEVSYS